MRTVFNAAKNHQSLSSHVNNVKLQQDNFGPDSMGTKCANYNAARDMTMAISEVIQKDLVEKIRTMNEPFSLILDGSTDRTQDHVLAVLFQWVTPEGEIQEGFYKLIKIGFDESAKGQFLAFEKEMKEDMLWDAAKER